MLIRLHQPRPRRPNAMSGMPWLLRLPWQQEAKREAAFDPNQQRMQ
jgi:hypothetical protein